jgi:aspartokinase-like uncharacterized kinase
MSRTGLPAECHVFTIDPVFPSLLPRFDIRVFWITSTFLERIMLAIQGSTVKLFKNSISLLVIVHIRKSH